MTPYSFPLLVFLLFFAILSHCIAMNDTFFDVHTDKDTEIDDRRLEFYHSKTCDQPRSESSYTKRLDIFYFYSVWFDLPSLPSSGKHIMYNGILLGLEEAISNVVSIALDYCDYGDQPIFAVQISRSSGHEISEGGR